MTQYAEKQKRTLIISIFIFLLWAAVIVAVGYKFYRGFELRSRAQTESQISAITQAKVSGLVEWRKKLLDDANFIYKNPVFSNLIEIYLNDPGDTGTKKYILDWLGNYQTYDQIDQIYLMDVSLKYYNLLKPLYPIY